jgi:predicted ribosome quality control (RQC) complex YloA/Tae2 family protein
MKTSLSSFDVYAVVQELRELRGARLNKVYQVGPQELKVVINIKGFGRAELVIEAGRRVHLTEYPKPSPKVPSSLAMALRKHLGNSFLEDVYQAGFDRVIVFRFQRAGREYRLVAELFGKGNIVLVGGDGKILALLRRQSFSTRELAVGVEYRYPPERPDPFSISPEELVEILRDSKADLVRTLATRLGLGGLYAEELCLRTGIEKSKMEITPQEAEKLIQELLALRDGVKDKKPCIVFDGEAAVDVLPVPLEYYGGMRHEFYPSFNKALDEYFTTHEIAGLERVETEEFRKELEHLMARLEEQRQTQTKYLEREQAHKKAGEAIFMHLGEVEEILDVIREARKKFSWREIMERLQKGKDLVPEAALVKEILPKEGVVVMELDGIRVGLPIGEAASRTAERYYEKGKRAREKAEGVARAIAETERLIREVKKKGRREVEEGKKPTKRVRKKRRWYEKFRWFYSRDGFLVIGGRDATSNEVLVKRYMSPEDIFVHADIHGAPAVVIKTGGRDVPDSTIEDAFDFAAAYSRAWKHGLVAIDVYWVRPMQVSKQAEHGEYVAKGAFIIRGKRNYGKGRVELAVGVVIEDEEVRVIGGPVAPVSAASRYSVKVLPGRLKSREAAEEVKKNLQEIAAKEDKGLIASIPLEDIQVFLPAGGCEVKPLSLS